MSLLAALDDLADVRARLEATLVEEPPALARDGGCVREGVDADLDALRDVSRNGKAHIAAMEEAERARTGISSLKVRFNRVFGYYIEVSGPISTPSRPTTSASRPSPAASGSSRRR